MKTPTQEADHVAIGINRCVDRMLDLISRYAETAVNNLSWELWEVEEIRTDKAELLNQILHQMNERLNENLV